MSKFTKLLLVVGMVGVIAGCAREPEPEPVVIAPAPVEPEPTFNKF